MIDKVDSSENKMLIRLKGRLIFQQIFECLYFLGFTDSIIKSSTWSWEEMRRRPTRGIPDICQISARDAGDVNDAFYPWLQLTSGNGNFGHQALPW